MYKIIIKYKCKGDTRWRQSTYRSVSRDDAIEQALDAITTIGRLDMFRIPHYGVLSHDPDWGGWLLLCADQPQGISFERKQEAQNWLNDHRSNIHNFVEVV